MGYNPQETTVISPTDKSHFIKDIVKGDEVAKAEFERALTAKTESESETDSEFSGFTPEDLKRGAISDPS